MLGPRGCARHDGGQGKVAGAAGIAVQDALEAEGAAGAYHGGDVAVAPTLVAQMCCSIARPTRTSCESG